MKRRGTKGLGVGLSVCHFYHFEVVVGCFGIGNDGKQWHLGIDVPFLFLLGFSATQRSDGADNS
jgi:hypothetical protein